MRVAIQGEVGSFHYQVAQQLFGNDVSIVAAETFGDVFGSLNQHAAQTAIVAVENSLYGSINEVLDLIEAHRYPIVGEVYLRIEQQLIALSGATTPESITRIYSHPVALAQCEQYLDNHYPSAQRIEYHDTAASVAYIKELNNPNFAAIASTAAAKHYNLPILASNIEDNKANFTRFLVISSDDNAQSKNITKASLVLTTTHQPGALALALTEFAKNGANLTKLQSRPIIGQPWNYRFYVDVETDSKTLARIITTIEKDGSAVTVLGTYIASSL